MSPSPELTKWVDLAFKLAVIIGPAVWLLLFNYLKTWFVMKEDFDKIVVRLDSIERTIIMMANQQNELDDHEQRLRALEQR